MVGPLADSAARHCGPARPMDRPVAAADRGGAASTAGASGTLRGPTTLATMRPRIVRRAGPADAGSGGSGVPRPATDLPRTQFPGQPVGPSPAAVGRRARDPGGNLCGSALWRWWWRCWLFSRRVGPTYPWIPRIPESGWPSCSRMPTSVHPDATDRLPGRSAATVTETSCCWIPIGHASTGLPR